MLTLRTARGRSLPLGATALADGINFSLLTRHGTAVWLVLYPMDQDEPLSELALHPRKNRTGNHWHILVGGLPETFRYGWRVDGPRGGGHRFDPSIVLFDPAATALSGGAVWGHSDEPDEPPGNGVAALPARSGMAAPPAPPRPRYTLRRSVVFRRPF